jgi:hypothetical protein
MNLFGARGKWWAFSLLSAFALQASSADAICERPQRVIGFFNGVWNSRDQAAKALDKLKQINAQEQPDEELSYELFYNITGTERGNTQIEDIAEVFIQRSPELGDLLAKRWEAFWETALGGEPESETYLGKLLDFLGVDKAAAREVELIKALKERIQAAQAEAFARMVSDPPTEETYREHTTRVRALVAEKNQLVLVAHSQGNLFVNHAYDAAMELTTASNVKVVHIAPASPTLRGEYALADLDLVINGLRVQGLDTVPPFNVSIPLAYVWEHDKSGHTLIPIYLAPALDTYARYNQMITNALTSLAILDHSAQATDDGGNIFSVTLAWNGQGDADLHVIEPDSTRVYWEHPEGPIGSLDVDNYKGFGPEHYFASCAAATYAAGRYRVEVSNYEAADNRVATLQLATPEGGVIYSRQLTLGAEMGDGVADGKVAALAPFEILVDKRLDQVGAFKIEVYPLGL